MLLRVPNYYHKFQCLAKDCKDSCCIGWEIDIDEETYEYYKQVDGAFGTRLKENMTTGEEHSFRLKKGRCPFLNQENLCDICIELGETSLCEICTEYPRFTFVYGQVREKCLGLSCEEVGRILFEQKEPVYLEEKQLEEPFIQEEYVEDETLQTPFKLEKNHVKKIEDTREKVLSILQNRSQSITERIVRCLLFCELEQHVVNGQAIAEEEVERNVDEFVAKTKKIESTGKQITYLSERLEQLQGMEVLDEEWRVTFQKIKHQFTEENCSNEEYVNYHREFQALYQERECEYEQLMVYFVIRYFMRAVYDGDILHKAKLAVVSFLMIRDMDVQRYLENGCTFSFNDRIDIARIYSKEVEHSEDNLEYLQEAFLFEDIFRVEELVQQILLK